MMIPATKQPNSILPDILEVARLNGVQIGKPVSGRPGEIRANCPFCLANIGKADRKFHLYINSIKNTFRCPRCIEQGGVVKFIAVLNGSTEVAVLEEIKNEFRRSSKGFNKKPMRQKKIHPAKALNVFQLREIDIRVKTGFNWGPFKDDPELEKMVADFIWSEWTAFIEYEKMQAIKMLHLAVSSSNGSYARQIEYIRNRSKEIGFDLLTPVLEEYSSSNPPEWVREGKYLASLWLG